MSSSQLSGLVLAVHPTSRGFGWVLFEGPMAPDLWAIATRKRDDYGPWCMKHFEKLLDQYRPRVLVLESRSATGNAKSGRAALLAQSMRGFAANHDIDVYAYSRVEVGAALVSNKSAKRDDVVKAVAKLLPVLNDRVPSERRNWESLDDRRCLFDAAALGLTHYLVTRPDA